MQNFLIIVIASCGQSVHLSSITVHFAVTLTHPLVLLVLISLLTSTTPPKLELTHSRATPTFASEQISPPSSTRCVPMLRTSIAAVTPSLKKLRVQIPESGLATNTTKRLSNMKGLATTATTANTACIRRRSWAIASVAMAGPQSALQLSQFDLINDVFQYFRDFKIEGKNELFVLRVRVLWNGGNGSGTLQGPACITP